MAFIDDARKNGREELNLVEINLDNKLHPSGTELHCDGLNPFGQRFFSSVQSIDFAPTKIVAFEGLTHVGQVVVTLQDFKFGGGDYFARLIAMNPYYFNREIYVKTGFTHSGFNINNFRNRLYFIKKIDYDWTSRKCTITAKDALSLLEERGATIPVEIRGKLSGAIPATVSVLSPPYNYFIPPEIYTAGTGYYAINNEVVFFDGSALIIRAQRGTKADDHNADSPMRKVAIFTDQNPVDALRTELTNSAGLGAYIDNAQWDLVRDTYTVGDLVNATIFNPMSVKNFTKKICEQFGLNIWFDDETQKLKINAVGFVLGTLREINHRQHIINTGHSFTKDIQKAITQTWYYYGKIDPTKGDTSENYSSLYINYDPALEGTGGHRTALIKKVYADFLSGNGLGVALKIAARIMSRFKEGYQEITFRLDAKDSDISVGDVVQITTEIIQDAAGAPLAKPFEIIEKKQTENGIYVYKGAYGGAIKTARLIAPNDMPNYPSASAENQAKYAFIDNAGGSYIV